MTVVLVVVQIILGVIVLGKLVKGVIVGSIIIIPRFEVRAVGVLIIDGICDIVGGIVVQEV